MVIQSLRQAALTADTAAASSIGVEHVHAGYTLARSAKRAYLLAKLSEHHKVIYETVRAGSELRSGELRRRYLQHGERANLRRAAPRTFSLYVKHLVEGNLLVQRQALGIKGNVRTFRLAERD